MSPVSVAVIGGGMITHDQVLPSLFHLQRNGRVGAILVCAQRGRTLETLAGSSVLRRAFPGQTFAAYPPAGDPPDTPQPDRYKEVIASLPAHSVVIVALPDQLHHEAILFALRANQHVIAVKPLVLRYSHSVEIEREAFERGLVVGIEYHKRFDDRSLIARQRYREGQFGQFRLGTAALLEKWYYRGSNFQNWCTVENSDAFTYIGCHYVDLVHFITGLQPVSVSLCGIPDQYPNGKSGYLWTDARVRWSNGAILNVQNALGFPDEAPGTNTQGMNLYCSSSSGGAWIRHDDQYRGIQYCFVNRPNGPGATVYSEPSPDYFQYLDMGGPGLSPAGYGYRSIEYLMKQCEAARELSGLEARREFLKSLDETGMMATPANSRHNELAIEAGRLSLQHNGREVSIEYGASPRVSLGS